VPTNAAAYSAPETLRDGRVLEIRALRPEDRAAMVAFADRMSDAARQLRFFAPRRGFSEREIDYFVNVDFIAHVALVAELDDGGTRRLVGGGRYIVTTPCSAEIAFAVDEACQGLGIASVILRHLAGIARHAGLRELVAEVLPENAAMLKVFARSALAMRTRREDGVVHVALAL
jgi:RimJ/RimL family protein N-acetyltransferase